MFRTLCNRRDNGEIHSFARIKEVVGCNSVILEYKTYLVLFVGDDVGFT